MKKQIRTDNSNFVNNLKGSGSPATDVKDIEKLKSPKGATTDAPKPVPKEVRTSVNPPKPVAPKQEPAPVDVQAQKEIAFFKRIHGHLPDKKCGGTFASPCRYMDDLEPINQMNEHEQDLMEYPEYPAKKAELLRRVEAFNNPDNE